VVGKFTEIEREMNLNADRKRFWAKRLTSIDNNMMNISAPLPLDLIAKNEI